jgi:hypothetical protein
MTATTATADTVPIAVIALGPALAGLGADAAKQFKRRKGRGHRQELTKERSAMRTLAVVLVLLSDCFMILAAPAAQSNDCKLCREDYQACVTAHSQGACKTNYEICLKHCRRK